MKIWMIEMSVSFLTSILLTSRGAWFALRVADTALSLPKLGKLLNQLIMSEMGLVHSERTRAVGIVQSGDHGSCNRTIQLVKHTMCLCDSILLAARMLSLRILQTLEPFSKSAVRGRIAALQAYSMLACFRFMHGPRG